jgi:integrase/recombinase XerD
LKTTNTVLWHGKERLQLPFVLWPLVDQTRWNEAIAPGSILDLGGGRAASWSQVTRRTLIKAYGRWLAWLDSREDLDPAQEPGHRITRERIAEYAASLAKTSENLTVWSYLQGLATMYEILEPTHDTGWLWTIVSVFQRSGVPSGRKRGRVVPSRDLFAFGREVMTLADGAAELGSVLRASLYRDGLMISVLAARPVRIKNFASIDIGTQLLPAAPGYCLHFDAVETKTKREIHVSFPEDLLGNLDTYLQTYRPILLEGVMYFFGARV